MKMNGKFFMRCLFCAAIGFALHLNFNPFHSNASSKLIRENHTTNPFADYRTWSRVNKKPIRMPANLSALCAPASAARQKNDSPHNDKFIVVYVNRLGQKGMMEEKHPRFSQGTVIVKEKLSSESSTSPELLTAMIKREKGFHPAANDWEFFVVSGDAKTIQEQGKLENCITCHRARRGDDFVFRNYLPSDALMKLK
jgi:hypothetical protein